MQPHLEHTYATCRGRSDDPGSGCFELLGFDVMMDHKLRPSLLEINHTPSFRCDSPLDAHVKELARQLDALLRQKIANPALELSAAGDEVLAAVKALLDSAPPLLC